MDTDAPAQSFRLLRKFIPGFLRPTLRGLIKRFLNPNRPRDEPHRTVAPYTQVHIARQRNLVRLAKLIEQNKIPGAIVECGVLDGGAAALMAYSTSQSGREIHLFDSWQGLPKTTDKDGDAAKVWVGEDVGSQARVRSIMRQMDVNPSRITYHKGWFDQTFSKAKIDSIALIHIDADFYESVRLSIETWFPRLSSGGYMQFDDYSAYIGCKRAVDEFLALHQDIPLVAPDGIVFYLQKP